MPVGLRAEAAAAGEAGPPEDFLLALVYPLDQSPPVLPTHRVVRGRPCGDDLVERLAAWTSVERLADREDLLARMAEAPAFAPGATGTGRIGLLTRDRAVHAQRRPASRRRRCCRRGCPRPPVDWTSTPSRPSSTGPTVMSRAPWPVTVASGTSKDAREATQQVVDEAASAAFLLDGMPAEAITQVAAAGEVMPQKSTYFDPKAPTGLAISPLA